MTRQTLIKFARAVTVEAHVLVRRPGALWSQLYNRLQWEDETVTRALSQSLRASSVSNGRWWLRSNRAYDESTKLLMTLYGHEDAVYWCAFSSNGLLIVSRGKDETVRLWDANSGKELVHTKLNVVDVSPDAFHILVSDDRGLSIRELRSGHTIAMLNGDTAGDPSCTWRSDGKQLLTGSNMVRLWDAVSGRLIVTFDSGQTVKRKGLSADGKRVIIQTMLERLQIWDCETGTKITTIEDLGSVLGWVLNDESNRIVIATSEEILVVDSLTGRRLSANRIKSDATWVFRSDVVSPQGDRVIYQEEGKVREAGTGRVVAQFERSPKGLLRFAPDGRHFAIIKDTAVVMFDTETGRKQGMLEGHSKAVAWIDFDANGSRVVSASEDQTLKVWSADVAKRGRSRAGHDGQVDVCVFSPDGKRIATFGGKSGTLRIWNAVTGELTVPIEGDAHVPNLDYTLRFSPDSSSLLAVTARSSMAIWDATTGEGRVRFAKGENPIIGCNFTPSGTEVISIDERIIRIWDASTGSLEGTLEGHSDWCHGFCMTLDGKWLISSGADHTARIWDLTTRKEVRRLQGKSTITVCAVSPDKNLIVTGDNRGKLRIWEFASGRELSVLKGHSFGIDSAVFSADGNRIFSTSVDRNLRVWDTASGAELACFVGAGGYAGFAISPDGRRIASTIRSTVEASGLEAPLVVWDLETGKELTSITLPSPICSSAYHPTEERLVCGDYKGGVHLLDLMSPGR